MGSVCQLTTQRVNQHSVVQYCTLREHKLVRRLFVFSIFAPIYVFVWSISGKCQLLYTRSDCTETRSSYTVCGGCGEGVWVSPAAVYIQMRICVCDKERKKYICNHRF